jgi:hypothetical protein
MRLWAKVNTVYVEVEVEEEVARQNVTENEDKPK